MIYGATVRSTIPRGTIAARRVQLPDGFVVADHRDIPGPNYVALIDPDQPCLAVDQIRHVAEPILLVGHADKHALIDIHKRVTIEQVAATPNYDPEKSDVCFKKISIDKGQIDLGFRNADLVIDGEYRTASSGAALHRNQWRDRGARRRRNDRLRIAAVPVLRAQGAGGAAAAAARARPRRADGNRRRVRRQGRIPVDARVPRGDPGAQGESAGEDDLRPRRGSAGDDEAASVDRAASHRPDARWPPHGDGRGRDHGRRRVRDAERRRAVARRDPRRRSVSMRSRAHSRPRDDDAHAAERRVPRLRRAADAVCDRSAHGSHRRRARHRSGAAARDQRAAARRYHRDRTEARQGRQRAAGAARCREAIAVPRRSARSGRAPIAASACRCSSTAPASPAAARSSSPRRRRSS